MNQQKIGNFIQEKRKEKKLSQLELSERLGVSNRTISKWENGNSMPDYSIINDLCAELDISINELFSGEELTEENYQKKFEENFVSAMDYNNKKRNKKIRKIVIFIIILLFIYLLYKAFIAYLYYKDYSIHEENSFPVNQNIETIEIYNNHMANTKVLDDRLNMYIPSEFELVTDRAKSHFVKDDCVPYVKGLVDNNTFDAMILICFQPIDISNMENLGIQSSVIPWLDPYSLLQKYDIHDTVDIIKYYEKHYDFKQNIFTKSDDIKINYIARTYTTLTIPSYDKFYYLENDLRGYSTEYLRGGEKYSQDAVIVYPSGILGETKYGIAFFNNEEEYFNHDNTFEIISSISR